MIDETLTFSNFVPILVALIPALGGAVAGIAQRQAGTPRPYRNLGHLVDMLAKAPAGEGKDALDKLVSASASALTEAVATIRKVNPANVALTIVLAGFSGLLMFWLAQWIGVAAGSGWSVAAWIVTVIVGFFLTLIVAAAIGTIYNPPQTKEDREAKKANRLANKR